MTDYFHLPVIDPVLLTLGPLSLRWYGLMYLVGFAGAWWLAGKRLASSSWNNGQIAELLFYAFLGAIVGGRLGYVVFYQFGYFLQEPLFLFKIWTGGMSFHGSLLGGLVSLWWFAKKHHCRLLDVGDFVAPLIPLGLAMGRLGNFINGELWGRTTEVPWAIVFPGAGPLPRHPSQLYEFILEGVVLFALLWWYSSKPKAAGRVSGVFLMGYGGFRIVVKFFREPDAHLGLYGGLISQGQILSLPMILFGLLFFLRTAKSDNN